MSNTAKPKPTITKMMIDGILQDFFAITSMEAVGTEFNEDGTVKVSLADKLTEFVSALEEKANSADVAEDISTACNELYNKILGKANAEVTINEAFDTLKEIADWIGSHGDAAATLTNDVSTLKTNVENLAQQIENGNTTVEASETNGNLKVDNKEVEVYKNPGANMFVASTAAETAIAEEKMKNGDILFFVVQPTELKDASDEVKTANHFAGVVTSLTFNGFVDVEKYENTTVKAYYATIRTNDTINVGDVVYLDMDNYTSSVSTDFTKLPETISGIRGYYKILKLLETNEGIHQYSILIRAVAEDTLTDISDEFVEYLGESYSVAS